MLLLLYSSSFGMIRPVINQGFGTPDAGVLMNMPPSTVNQRLFGSMMDHRSIMTGDDHAVRACARIFLSLVTE